MKVLISVDNLKYGGAERVAISVANGLSRLGHTVTILTDEKKQDEYPVDKKVDIVRMYPSSTEKSHRSRILGKLMKRWQNLKRIKAIIKEKRPDVVVNFIGYYLPEHLIACRLSKTKLVFSDHNAYERPAGQPFPRKQKFQKFKESRLCDLTTVLTRRDKDVLKGRKNVEVMLNPLFLSPTNELLPKQKTILAVGRIDIWECKGFDILIRAWGKICDDFPDWKLKIKGAGSDKSLSLIKKIMDESGAKRTFIENFSLDIEKEYAKSEVFVLSSRYEGFGLVLTEAMSRHCACIACDYKGRQADIITDGIDGLLCEADNVDALASKMRLLLENDDLRKSLQQHSADNLDRFSELNVAKNWENLLLNLTNHTIKEQ